MKTESIKTRQAWEKLHNRLRQENLIPEDQVAAGSRLVNPLLRIAAAVLVLLGIGAIIYVTTLRKPASEMVQLSNSHGDHTLIKTLADGSVIYVAQSALFSYPEEFQTGERNVQLVGEAFFDVASNPGSPFIIETDDALIQVLGTAFNVNSTYGRALELSVDRGAVKVTLKSDLSNSEMVMAGEKITSVKNSLVKSKYTPGEADYWYKKRMHFKDEMLQNIIIVLNRNFNTTFVLADKEIGKHRLTVTFDNETAETMTDLICLTLNLQSQTIDGAIILSKNRESAKQN